MSNLVIPSSRFSRFKRLQIGATVFLALANGVPANAMEQETVTALELAELLRAARSVIASNQPLINDLNKGPKGLTFQKVLEDTYATFRKKMGTDPLRFSAETKRGKLIQAQISSIKEVIDKQQETINQKGVGFKGFVPAVFARLVNEQFRVKMRGVADIKITAPYELVRNRKALPDKWEGKFLNGVMRSKNRPKGKNLKEISNVGGTKAFRILVPEYYSKVCLSCHGGPKGKIDVTGYPKEGAKLGDLGGAISITLFMKE